MTWRHPTDEQLEQFALEGLEGAAAVEVALHIDECPRCAGVAASADPLAHAFAVTEDPVLPIGLVDAILEDAEDPVSLGPEPAIAAGLLGGAGLLLVLAGDPTQLVAGGATVLSAILSALTVLLSNLTTPTIFWTGLAGFMLLGSIVMARRIEARRSV